MGRLLVDRCQCFVQSQVAGAKDDITSLEMKQGTLGPTTIKFMIWDSERDICKTPDYPDVYAKCDIVQIICGSQDLEGRQCYDVYVGSDIKVSGVKKHLYSSAASWSVTIRMSIRAGNDDPPRHTPF
ncbi:hypothetical protein GOP47_0023332 [Adiantum capillus-veneris]|uniref:Uncharacterized protein n=1 Tax=Adiantum capillus-veneris TaxID=13818 RepID=A0A9D4U3P6_ADICA|nr:hypothetical protein GOP47_0023332 [Adiantum capillus-veneris]